MKIILGTSRQQMHFSSLDDFIAADNPVRIIDAFAEKLDLAAVITCLPAGRLKIKFYSVAQ